MHDQKIIRVKAKSCAARLLDDESAVIIFLTEENDSLRIRLPKTTLIVLAKRINEATATGRGYRRD